ncbi:MAG: DUF3999 domain-containing protein [Deltaproteobacteria bacterium]|nr:DUF3999 domain-containing protein [Deltaproteobacteria bacterium]
MKRFLFTLVCCSVLLTGVAGHCTAFDERLWEKYAEIEIPSAGAQGGLAGVYLEPQHLGDLDAKRPFADFRVVTDLKEELPCQIVSRKPEKREIALPHRMENLSLTPKGETWLELRMEQPGTRFNAVEIVTPDTDFSRQVQVFGSSDGKEWKTLRKDGVIFDFPKREKLRRTRIAFPPAAFPRIALKIENIEAPPLTISEVKVLQESDSLGQTYTIPGTAEKPELDASRRESSIVVRMNTRFPLDRLVIATPERNFQRTVEVQVRRGTDEWQRWAQGTLFSFDTPTMRETQLAVDMPEIAAKEFRLVFKNLDSPPLSVTGVTGRGYRRLLVFKQQPDRKLYLFWGNPPAEPPRYDLAGAVAKQNLDGLPLARLGPVRANGNFAGNDARLPFTERYKHVLFILVILCIAGLVFIQYRVFRHMKR